MRKIVNIKNKKEFWNSVDFNSKNQINFLQSYWRHEILNRLFFNLFLLACQISEWSQNLLSLSISLLFFSFFLHLGFLLRAIEQVSRHESIFFARGLREYMCLYMCAVECRRWNGTFLKGPKSFHGMGPWLRLQMCPWNVWVYSDELDFKSWKWGPK